MHFELIDALSLPGDPANANEDAFANTAAMAVVIDGATGLGERLMPGPSDAQWIAQFAARRLRARSEDGGSAYDWLKGAARDAESSFSGLRRRLPKEQYELPFASLMMAAIEGEELRFLWFGDCAALLLAPSGAFEIIGDTMAARGKERARAAGASQTPAACGVRDEFLPLLRKSRNRVNTEGHEWLFAPQRDCADHAAARKVAAVPATQILLASDGFLALAADYGRYTPESLLDAAKSSGLNALVQELRKVEAADPDGRAYPRFKRSDDATALILSLAP
jgi:hypothetical protein